MSVIDILRSMLYNKKRKLVSFLGASHFVLKEEL